MLFFIMTTQIFIPTNSVEGFSFLQSSSALVIFHFLIAVWYLIVFLSYI
jgi:hypothetical protein